MQSSNELPEWRLIEVLNFWQRIAGGSAGWISSDVFIKRALKAMRLSLDPNDMLSRMALSDG